MDSTGLTVLTRAYHQLGQTPGAIVVRAPADSTVLKLLRTSGIDHLVTVQPA